MMEINVVCVGSLKEDYWKDAIKEYQKRIGAFAKINIVEVNEAKYLSSQAEMLHAKKEEAEQLKRYKKGYAFALEVKGKNYSSEDFAQKIKSLLNNGTSTLSFFIGGSVGLDADFSNSCNEKISFSSFTFPHQLMRVILMEQIYRSCMINANKTYHK